ncbi:hypothetical protein AVEN_243783-1 [Araneus ventricosus]|uniref:Reverse transcriptase/retrotransposon-derived protein RNase H-like domain-containing protein n=1 Tax=Araneus ventricosus TaxID=182803 RepID=A0A4Y2A6H4_ARAVE|nr:hypothetical protein AVEN_243783-1 [Araneus ventricosus]
MPGLYAPDYKREFIIQTDASDVGMGVMSQRDEKNEEHPVLYLIILMSRFEATRGLFWDGPRNFEPWSDDEDDT